MPRGEVSTMSNGREYVSVEEFARRTGCSAPTIYSRIRLGLIPTENFGKKKIYIDWELGSKAYNVRPAAVTFKRSTYEKREAKKEGRAEYLMQGRRSTYRPLRHRSPSLP